MLVRLSMSNRRKQAAEAAARRTNVQCSFDCHGRADAGCSARPHHRHHSDGYKITVSAAKLTMKCDESTQHGRGHTPSRLLSELLASNPGYYNLHLHVRTCPCRPHAMCLWACTAGLSGAHVTAPVPSMEAHTAGDPTHRPPIPVPTHS